MTARSIYAGGQVTADDIQGVAPLAAVKKNDTSSAVNSTAYANDPDLLLNLAASSVYRFLFTPFFTAVAGSDMAIQFTVPSGATLTFSSIYQGTSVALDARTQSNSGARYAGSGTSLRGAIMAGTILTSSAGLFRVQFGQATAGATAAVMKAGSELDAWKIG